MRRTSEPSGRITRAKNPKMTPTAEFQTMDRPSGDQSGPQSATPFFVSRRSLEPSAPIM